jgi:hypothetical protein
MVDNEILDTEKEFTDASTQESAEPVQVGQEENQANQETTQEVKQEAADNAKPGNNDSRDAEYTKHVQNWRALREAREQAERERDEARAQLRQYQPAPRQEQQPLTYGDDDLIEGKHLKQNQQQIDSRIAQLEGQLIETKLKAAYPDFEEVVNKDTLGMLRDADPELAESLAANPNFYSKAVAAYKSIKRYGLSADKFEREKEKVTINTAKPRTVTSIAPQQGESPLSRANAFANGLTDELKAQMWQEMKDIMRNS